MQSNVTVYVPMLLNIAEHIMQAYLKHCISHVLEHCQVLLSNSVDISCEPKLNTLRVPLFFQEDLEFFEKFVSKDDLRERLAGVVAQDFARITYTEAVNHVLKVCSKEYIM